MLAAGADPNVRDTQGCPLLHVAARAGLDVLDAILTAGADPNARDRAGRLVDTVVLTTRFFNSTQREMVRQTLARHRLANATSPLLPPHKPARL